MSGAAIVGCEESQEITIALRAVGVEAYSCDLKPCSGGHPEWHIQEDVLTVIKKKRFDLGIMHPTCTFLTVTGNKWFFHPEDKHLPVEQRRPHPRFPDRMEHRREAVAFFMALAEANIPRLCLENPVGVMSTIWREPDQIIQPYNFGHVEPKKTCLWLKNLPLLKPHWENVEPEYHTTKSGKRLPKWYAYADKSQGQEHRAALRSKTFSGIAKSMAEQWGPLVGVPVTEYRELGIGF
jgi:uncharacterized cysteine cluster protein YcgN (CxxCxxCC family)